MNSHNKINSKQPTSFKYTHSKITLSGNGPISHKSRKITSFRPKRVISDHWSLITMLDQNKFKIYFILLRHLQSNSLYAWNYRIKLSKCEPSNSPKVNANCASNTIPSICGISNIKEKLVLLSTVKMKRSNHQIHLILSYLEHR